MSARLMRCLGLALVTLAGGACVFRTYETRPVATLGYHRPRTVALVFTHGDPGLAASLRQRLVGSGLVSVGSERIATLEDGTEPEALCRALTGVAAPVVPAPAPPVGRVGDPVVPPVPASSTASDPRFPPPPTPPGPTTASPAPTASDPRFPPPPTSPAPPTSPPTTSDPRFPPPPTPPALPVTSAGPPGAGVPAPEAPPLPPPPPPGTAPVTGHDPDGRPPEPPRPSPWLREAPITSPGAPIAPPFPADLIVVVDARVAVHSDFHCPIYRAKVEWSWPKDDDDDGGGGGGGCSEWSYDATDGLARARLVALSPTTCSIIQDVADQADSRVVGRDAIDGEAKARAAAIDALRARDLAALVERFLPHGLEVVAARGPALELSGPTPATLTVGQTYPLVGTRRDGRTQLGRLRVDRADADGAVGVVDPSPLPLRLGDEVRSLSYPHEWKLVPVLTAGDLVADARSSTVVGVGLGLRWTYPRAYLQGELLLSDQWVLDFDTKRYDLGVALGGRLPLGPLVPYAMGELGGAFLPREQLGDTTTYHTKSFQGVVGGLEVWAGRYVFLVDARLRRATGVALGTAITETYRERTLQLGFAAPI